MNGRSIGQDRIEKEQTMTRICECPSRLYGTNVAVIVALMLFSGPIKAGALDDARTAVINQDFATAASKFQEAVNQGDPEAMAIMGTKYFYGIGVPYDREKAFALNLKAAELGRVDAEYLVRWEYQERLQHLFDTESKDKTAAEMFKWAKRVAVEAPPKAEAGDPIAQWIVGEMYYRGIYYSGGGINADQDKAILWLVKAAEQNVVGAQYTLATIFERGAGDSHTKDYRGRGAREWYAKAADAGHAGAEDALAVMLEKSGEIEQAKLLFARAALAGDSYASAMLRKYGIAIGDPSAFDQQQARLSNPDYIALDNRLLNFADIVLGHDNDDAVRNYRAGIQRNTDHLMNQVLTNMHTQDRTNSRAMR